MVTTAPAVQLELPESVAMIECDTPFPGTKIVTLVLLPDAYGKGLPGTATPSNESAKLLPAGFVGETKTVTGTCWLALQVPEIVAVTASEHWGGVQVGLVKVAVALHPGLTKSAATMLWLAPLPGAKIVIVVLLPEAYGKGLPGTATPSNVMVNVLPEGFTGETTTVTGTC